MSVKLSSDFMSGPAAMLRVLDDEDKHLKFIVVGSDRKVESTYDSLEEYEASASYDGPTRNVIVVLDSADGFPIGDDSYQLLKHSESVVNSYNDFIFDIIYRSDKRWLSALCEDTGCCPIEGKVYEVTGFNMADIVTALEEELTVAKDANDNE
jgi:hypothetical protein